jgi:hypothetical protein
MRLFMPFVVVLGAAWGLNAAAAPDGNAPTWRQFVEAGSNGTEPILPDLSYTGYHGGVDAIPEIRGPISSSSRPSAPSAAIRDAASMPTPGRARWQIDPALDRAPRTG